MTNFEIYTYLKSKNGGGGEPVPVPVTNPALRLMDWEGTVLKEYSAEQVASLTALPTPSSLRADVDRELLLFQGYNWSVSDIKSWVTAHEGQRLTVGAIYTTTDGQDHNYWDYPRFDTADMISVQKRGTASIDNEAFIRCRLLENINIPNSVTSIGTRAFYNCYALENINLPNSVTNIGTHAFSNCYALENINLPNSVTNIGTQAFYGCYALENINIPDGVTSIGTQTFSNCYALENINIPDGVTSIGNSAFQGCYSLTSVNIPDSVTSIGEHVFESAGAFTDVVIQGKPSLSNINAFGSTYDGLRIYVPREYLSWYSTATNWDVFYDDEVIVAIEDYIEYLESIGIDVSDYEEEQT